MLEEIASVLLLIIDCSCKGRHPGSFVVILSTLFDLFLVLPVLKTMLFFYFALRCSSELHERISKIDKLRKRYISPGDLFVLFSIITSN